jgi:hypothetical protein
MANDVQVRTAQGVVEATAQNSPSRYGIRVGELWYDGFGQCPVETGDEVEIDYVERGRFRNIEGLKRLESEEDAAEDAEEAPRAESVEARIARAVALKCATMLSTPGASSAEVLGLAQQFEKWLRAAF